MKTNDHVFTFSELVNVEEIQRMMDHLNSAMDITIAIVDSDNTILVASGWRRICTDFHRVNQQTQKRCVESDNFIAEHLNDGEKYISYQCKNGLWDLAIPIVIQDKHLATFFVGQLFFQDELPDYDYFRQQAHEFGFDEADYLKALADVPIFSRDQIDHIMSFYSGFVHHLVKVGLQNITLAREITMRKFIQEKVETQEARYRSLIESLPQNIFVKDTKGIYLTCNQNYANILKRSKDEIIGSLDTDLFPPEYHDKFLADDRRVLESGTNLELDEEYILDGEKRLAHTIKIPLIDTATKPYAVLGIFWDVTEERNAQKKLVEYQQNLEKMVEERTQKITKQNTQLERMNKLFVGREFRIKELREKIADLEKRLEKAEK